MIAQTVRVGMTEHAGVVVMIAHPRSEGSMNKGSFLYTVALG
jgi:hypothetical protein